MTAIITFIIGAIGGFAAHIVGMRVSFKQRSIDHKIAVYDKLIGQWVQMRNFIYSHVEPSREVMITFDQMYGQSQQYVGEAILVCEDEKLTEDINSLNERMYRTKWGELSEGQNRSEMEAIKKDAFELIARMREDIKSSTRLDSRDFLYIFGGFWRRKTQAHRNAA